MLKAAKYALGAKKNYLQILFAILFLTGLQFNYSQAGDKIKIHLQQPPPNKLGVADLWKLDLENTTRENLTIYLVGTLTEAKDGMIVEGQSKPFVIKPGKTSYSYNDFKSGSVVWSNPKSREAIVRTGNAPSGVYTICATAKLESGETAGQENCIEQKIEITGDQQIIVVAPADGEELDPDTLPELTFIWRDCPFCPPPVVYALRIVEIKGEQSPDAAIQNNSAFFEQKEIRGTTLQYPLTAPVFEAGKKYAWAVKSGEVKSEVNTFKILKNVKNTITLISPINGAALDTGKAVTFEWSGVLPKPEKPVTYRLRVWQLMEGQNGSQAMRSNQPVVSKDVDNMTQIVLTGIITGPCKPPFMCDFVWNVEALIGDGFNNPQTETNRFKIIFKYNSSPYVLFPDDIPYELDAKINSKIHGNQTSERVTLHVYDKELKSADKIYLFEPTWAGATSNEQKAYEKLNTNKIDNNYAILESALGELYAVPLLVLFDFDPVMGFAEACNKCPTTHENKRGCSGSFCFSLLDPDTISKPRSINIVPGPIGPGIEGAIMVYPSQLDNEGIVFVTFECMIPNRQVTYGELQRSGYAKMKWCCNTTDTRCCHILEKSGVK